MKSPDEMWKLNPIFGPRLLGERPCIVIPDWCVSRSGEVVISAVWSRRDFLRPHAALPAATRCAIGNISPIPIIDLLSSSVTH